MIKWILIGVGVVAFIILMVWGVDATMCKEALC
jgi:hypothetical protein